MTVEEVIEELEKLPRDLPVLVPHGVGVFYSEVMSVAETKEQIDGEGRKRKVVIIEY